MPAGDFEEEPTAKELMLKQEGEWKKGGEFLVDRKAMERKVDEELAKIVNEQLVPYKTYLRHSAILITQCSALFLSGCGTLWLGIFCAKISYHIGFLFFFLTLVLLCASSLLVFENIEKHGFFIHPLYKIWRARKVFRLIAAELREKAMSGEVEVKNLKAEFLFKIKEIKNSEKALEETKKKALEAKEKERQEVQKLIDQAKNQL